MSSGVVQAPSIGTLMAKVGDRKLTTGQRLQSVGEVMKAYSAQMMQALPKHVTADRMIRVAMNCIRKTPKLLDCTPASLFASITEAATYGWELGGVLGHAYLVPFGSECQLVPGYKGLVDLCRRSGHVSTISLEVVHEGDKFEYSMGDDPRIVHMPNDADPDRDEKPITYAYAVVKLRDGGVQRNVWSANRINAHKEKYSKGWQWAENGEKSKGGGKKDSPWHTSWATMAKKTVLRDMINRGLVPMSAEYREVAGRAILNEEEPLDLGAMPVTLDHVPQPRIEDDSIGADESQQTGLQASEEYVASIVARFDAFGVDDQKSDVNKVWEENTGPNAPIELSEQQEALLTAKRDEALARITAARGGKQKQSTGAK